MINKYIKPETQTIKVEFQQIMAGSIGQLDPDPTNTVTPGTEEARGFDFFFEEEETPAKSDDEDWEDWEEEDDP